MVLIIRWILACATAGAVHSAMEEICTAADSSTISLLQLKPKVERVSNRTHALEVASFLEQAKQEAWPHHRRIFDLARWATYDCQEKGKMLVGYANPTVLEVGAHDGEELHKFRDAAHVWTIEPSPDKEEMIRQHIADSRMTGSVDYFKMALSDKSGEMRMWIDGPNSQQNTVGKPPPWVSQRSFEINSVTVPVMTLDDFWNQKIGRQHITMLKMDVQGHEPHILEGARRLLAEDPPDIIHTEFSPNLMKQAGIGGARMLHILYDAGYICFDCQAFGPPAMEPSWRDIDVYEQHFGSFVFKGADHGQWTDLVCMI